MYLSHNRYSKLINGYFSHTECPENAKHFGAKIEIYRYNQNIMQCFDIFFLLGFSDQSSMAKTSVIIFANSFLMVLSLCVWTDIESFILLNPWIASNKSSPKEKVEKNTMMKETATCLKNKGDNFSALNFMTMTMLSAQV